jgi:hypothetical protein
MTDYSYEDQSTTGSYGQEITTPQYAGVGQNGSATPKPAIQKKPMGFVGFSNLPNQVHRKSVRKGFQFTAMVVGAWRLLPVVSLFIEVAGRRVWPRKVYSRQHALRDNNVPSEDAAGACSGAAQHRCH